MKKLVLWALCIVLTVPAVIASDAPRGLGRFEEPTMLPDSSVTFAQLMEKGVVAKAAGPLRPRLDVVMEGSEAAFVLPIVGSAAGAGGTYFRSETVIINRSSFAQDIEVFYFPVGGGAANCNRPARTMRMNANTWYFWADFVAEFLGTSGLGAVIVFGVTPSGQFDSTAAIDGNSRIWTAVPGGLGTASQNFPSMSLEMPAGGQSAFGLRHDEFYRTNWGVFNYDTRARVFDVYADGFRGESSTTATIDACSLVLAGVPGGPLGSFQLYIEPRDGGGNFFSFGSSVDNLNGDSWSVVGRSF